VGASGELTQHARGVGSVSRFLEDVVAHDVANDYDSVGREHRLARKTLRDHASFIAREPLGIRARRFVLIPRFLEVWDFDAKGYSRRAQQLGTARRRGSEDENAGSVHCFIESLLR